MNEGLKITQEQDFKRLMDLAELNPGENPLIDLLASMIQRLEALEKPAPDSPPQSSGRT